MELLRAWSWLSYPDSRLLCVLRVCVKLSGSCVELLTRSGASAWHGRAARFMQAGMLETLVLWYCTCTPSGFVKTYKQRLARERVSGGRAPRWNRGTCRCLSVGLGRVARAARSRGGTKRERAIVRAWWAAAASSAHVFCFEESCCSTVGTDVCACRSSLLWTDELVTSNNTQPT